MPPEPLNKLEAKLVEAKAQQLELEKQIADEKRRVANEQAALIDKLPAMLGVGSLEIVHALIRARIRGEHGSLIPFVAGRPAQPRGGRRLSDEKSEKLMGLIGAGRHTIAEIAQEVGCSVATVSARKLAIRKALATGKEKTGA